MADWPEVLPRFVHNHASTTDARLIKRTDILKREVEDLRALVMELNKSVASLTDQNIKRSLMGIGKLYEEESD